MDHLTLDFIMLKMAKHTLKILRCEHRKTFKVCLAIFQNYEKRVNFVFMCQHYFFSDSVKKLLTSLQRLSNLTL